MTETTAPPGTEVVLARQQGGVLILTLNRPDRLNAWNESLEQRYFALLDEAESDPEVRAVVVTGAGRGFCAGADMDDLRALVETGDFTTMVRRDPPRYRPLLFGKPLVAAINGAAAGLGLIEALYCDVRFSTPKAKFTAAFSRLGLIGEYGAAWLLPRLVGRSRALDILLSSRVILGEEAFQLGLVDRIVAPEMLLDAAVAYAEELADNCSPAAMRTIKRQLIQANDSTFAEAIDESDRLMLEALESPDFNQGLESYLEGRPPTFSGLAIS
ncbi:enoyl-CoA hydratase/isomerase [Rhodococcus opacus M213]|uniref:Enoyl-CoA hydratase/isomerase n=1 Tax=Rhodococcus opacus M213 TaxID=1129896 RepID=K8X9T7_RHOOP|nr:enoyl-CoA hydratase-related protein [Rhodococcus opacus]EKT78279.1 enoyl-CoA hydratase/isomerase [Rhodococcus opacus M213]